MLKMQSTMKKRYISDLLQHLLIKRFGNHKKDFNHKQHSKNTELSKYIWSLKDAKIPCNIKWLIMERVYWKTKIECCPLCLAENLHLIEYLMACGY